MTTPGKRPTLRQRPEHTCHAYGCKTVVGRLEGTLPPPARSEAAS